MISEQTEARLKNLPGGELTWPRRLSRLGGKAMTNQPVFIEVSHPIEPGMKTYPGLPEPQAEILLDYEEFAPDTMGRLNF